MNSLKFQDRRRYKFLDHYSETEDIYFVDINMRSILSQDLYDQYLKDSTKYHHKKE